MNYRYITKLNSSYFSEQIANSLNINNMDLNKVKFNFTIKNREQNKYLFYSNFLLLERFSGQKPIFIKEDIRSTKLKPIKVGCSITVRKEVLYDLLKIIFLYSFPKIFDNLASKNNKFSKQKITFFNLNYFLFISSFSYSNDFDKFLSFYEDLNYYLSIEFYTNFEKYLINKSYLSSLGFFLL